MEIYDKAEMWKRYHLNWAGNWYNKRVLGWLSLPPSQQMLPIPVHQHCFVTNLGNLLLSRREAEIVDASSENT